MEFVDFAVVTLAVASIVVGVRKRPVDTVVVREIAQSIERHGLLQPIGVVAVSDEPGTYSLVFGAHRLAAYRLLEVEEIEARLLPADLSEEEYLLIELQENSARNDLTGVQRKAYAAEIGRLITKMATDSGITNGKNDWFVALVKQVAVPQQTVYNWWHAFCKDTNRTLTPRQALGPDKEAFFVWLRAQQEREAAEKARKEAEAFVRRRAQDFADALDNLAVLARDYGRDAVLCEVIDVFVGQG